MPWSRRRASVWVFGEATATTSTLVWLSGCLAGWLLGRKTEGKPLKTSPSLTSLFLNWDERLNWANAKHLSERGHECRYRLDRDEEPTVAFMALACSLRAALVEASLSSIHQLIKIVLPLYVNKVVPFWLHICELNHLQMLPCFVWVTGQLLDSLWAFRLASVGESQQLCSKNINWGVKSKLSETFCKTVLLNHPSRFLFLWRVLIGSLFNGNNAKYDKIKLFPTAATGSAIHFTDWV